MADTHGRAQLLTDLKVAEENGEAVAIYSRTDDREKYEVGFIEACDQHQIVLKCLTARGEPDGRRLISMDDVVRIETDSAYLRRVQLLYQFRDTIFDRDFREAAPGSSLREQLEHARDRNTIVHLADLCDSGPRGFVKEVGPDYVVIMQIGRTGEPDGRTTIMLENVHKVHIGRRQDQIFEFLYRYNFELKRLLEH